MEVSTENVNDEVCHDEINENQSKQLSSVETQTLECGVARTVSSTSVFDYYTLRYDDSDD